MEKPQTWFARIYIKKTHLTGQSYRCFFYWFYCLLIITTNAITKANAMIVTDTRPVKSNFIINKYKNLVTQYLK